MAVDLIVEQANAGDQAWLRAHDRHIPAVWVDRCVRDREYLIARSGGAAAGFLRFTWFWRSIPYMELIHVVEDRRRSGVGTALVALWEAQMRAAGARLLMTSCMADELAPQAWHRRNGFQDCGDLRFGLVQPEAELFLVKDI